MSLKRARLLRDESATSTPEYAIVLVVVIVAVVSVVSVLGSSSAKAFSLSSLGEEQTIKQTQSVQGTSRKLQTASHDGEPTGPLSEQPIVVAFVIAQAVLAISMVVLLTRKKRRKKEIAPIVLPEEVFAEQANSFLLRLRHKSSELETWEPLAGHFMSAAFESVPENAGSVIIKKQLDKSVHNTVIVVDKSKNALGIITPRDLHETSGKARQLMTSLPVSFDSKTPIVSVLRAMLVNRSTFATVTTNDALVGVISYVEAANAFQASLQMLREIQSQHRETLLRTLAPGSQTTPTYSAQTTT